jgi:mannitol/fructose-specific phosphotransferase system IIA component (Ntr-type)
VILQRLLHEESVRIHLEAPNREAALAELIAGIPSKDVRSREKAQILELVLQRERFGTTAIGEGVALPHCIFAGIEEPLMLLGISRNGIGYPSLDGQPVHFIFMMVFPERYLGSPERHQILREAESVFKDRFLKERLKICDTREEAYEIFNREAEHLAVQSIKSA